MPSLEPVVELPHKSHVFWQLPARWPIADFAPEEFVRLSGELSPAEVGSIVHLLITYNGDLFSPSAVFNDKVFEALAVLSPQERIGRIIDPATERLTLPGSLSACDPMTGVRVVPGCCTSLNYWREWARAYTEGASLWLGHDPYPWTERCLGEALIRVHADTEGSLRRRSRGKHNVPPFVDIPLCDFPIALEEARKDMLAFLEAMEEWGGVTVDSETGRHLADAFDRHFHVRPPLAELTQGLGQMERGPAPLAPSKPLCRWERRLRDDRIREEVEAREARRWRRERAERRRQ